jgi:transcriptional regulator with XRE-family HTH domain
MALRQRREELDLSQEEVAIAVGVSTTTYRSWEAGTATPRVGRRRRLGEALRWPTARVAEVLDHSGPLNGHAVPQWLGHLASLEQAAAHLWAFEATTVHGLLQTEAYAAAVERSDATPKNEAALAQRVRIRLARQAVLTRRPEPLQLSVIIDESVLRRRAGDNAVMVGQLDHLLDVACYPNVELQVLPLDAGVFVFGGFTLVANEQSADPFMAITEDRAGAHYLDRLGEVDAHVTLFGHLADRALSADDSSVLIQSVKETYA